MQLFLSCWANELDLPEAIERAPEWGYDGVEGPADPAVAERLRESGLPYIAEIATGGDYVPSPCLGVQAHLDDLERNLNERVSAFAPVRVNVLGGSDAWSFGECVSFYESAITMGKSYAHDLIWETHRSRPTFSPWQTRDLLNEIPEMRLNCDFSHWCVVCERLVLNDEPELLALCAERCAHAHLRIGYDQGPQLFEPVGSEALEAHLVWWRELKLTTATPEFGPDGYGRPGVDLPEINRWMAGVARERLAN